MRYVTAAQMREIDRRTIEEYRIPSTVLMENAGRACAEETMRLIANVGANLKPAPANADFSVLVFAGKGNNGGDGFVAARYLAARGFEVVVFFFQNPADMKPDPLSNFQILEKMKGNVRLVPCFAQIDFDEIKQRLEHASVVIDALFGTGLSKPIEDPFKSIIESMNESKVPILSVDIPSGLNADTGEVMGRCVSASATVTFGLPKKGFVLHNGNRYIGKLTVADIGIPADLLNQPGA